MPELAEVETVRRQIEEKLRGRRIKELLLDEADRYLFAFATPRDVRAALLGARIRGAGRKGKYFWIELDRKPWPLFHLGMSGNVALLTGKGKNARHEKIWGGSATGNDEEPIPQERLWFCRLLLKMDRGFEMALIDPRRFGRMWLTDDPWDHPRLRRLGYDPLLDFPSARVLEDKLRKRNKAIKSVLLDQGLFAGIGNWLADEILYQARLSPHHRASGLTSAQIKELRKQVLAVVRKAVAVDADYEKFPKGWLFHHRWGKNKEARTARGQRIVHEEIGGRTTAWVPSWQK